MSADVVAALIASHTPFLAPGRPHADLALKCEKLCASPLGFLRGTFGWWVARWSPRHDPLRDLAPQPVVGDLHLENYGAWKAADGTFAFGINDFDETGTASPGMDLGRLATSVVLADDDPQLRHAASRLQDLVEAWAEAARAPHEAELPSPRVVEDLLDTAREASRSAWLAKRVEGADPGRRFVRSDRYRPVDADTEAKLRAAVEAWARDCDHVPADCPSWPEVLDVAARTAGNGSLGRFRWVVLLPGRGEKVGKEHVLELKEARPSALAPKRSGQAARAIEAQRTFQAASPVWLGTARVGTVPCTVRELQPTEAKVQVDALSSSALDDLVAALGAHLGRGHRRANPGLGAALRGDRALARRVAAFALIAAERTVEDHAALSARREELLAAFSPPSA